MGKPHTAADFSDQEAWRILGTKVARGLYEAVDHMAELCICGDDVTKEEIQEIREQAGIMKEYVCAYIDGLAELYCVFGCHFSGDKSAEEELYAKFGGKGQQFGHGGVKHISDTLRKFFPNGIIPKKR